VLSDLALLYSAEGNLARTGELLERALRIAEADPASPDCAGLMNNLGFLYYRRGKYARSREMFQRAVQVIESRPEANRADLVTILGNLGKAELAAHDVHSAEVHFARARVEAKRFFGDDPGKVRKAR
jgi:tetratricopeptide (TPR) repeat protein